MMNMITTDLMDACGVTWPEAHTDAQMMADLALASYQHGCFENVGVPPITYARSNNLFANFTASTAFTEYPSAPISFANFCETGLPPTMTFT